jgi:hypothetical protein
MRRLLSDYGLSIVIAVLFIGSWLIQTVTGWVEFVSEQQQHNEPAEVFGPNGYLWRWGQATFENWQSEFLQVFTFIVLTAFLIHKGSHESKDSDEEMGAKLGEIHRELRRLQAKQDGRDPDEAVRELEREEQQKKESGGPKGGEGEDRHEQHWRQWMYMTGVIVFAILLNLALMVLLQVTST